MLEQAIRCVVQERSVTSELIVVDDNSLLPVVMPDMAYLAFASPNALQLIRNETNLGVIGARNVGVAAASGEYIIFLDDDDESFPNRTIDLLREMEGTGYDFVTARAYMHNYKSEKIVPVAAGFELTPETHLQYPAHIDAIIWRRTTLLEMGGLDTRVPYLGEHISLVLCLLRGGNGWLSSAVVARFGYIPAGLTLQTQQQNNMKSQLIAMFQILLEESQGRPFQEFCVKILAMLEMGNIREFDDYLLLLNR